MTIQPLLDRVVLQDAIAIGAVSVTWIGRCYKTGTIGSVAVTKCDHL